MSKAKISSQVEHNDSGLHGQYKTWFLDYASYVILERAVPAIEDGLKPVQRRILHAMNEMDDGRFNKVANIIGQAMQYHPHGDASIGDALVNMGQKDLLIDTQGNWGNMRPYFYLSSTLAVVIIRNIHHATCQEIWIEVKAFSSKVFNGGFYEFTKIMRQYLGG